MNIGVKFTTFYSIRDYHINHSINFVSVSNVTQNSLQWDFFVIFDWFDFSVFSFYYWKLTWNIFRNAEILRGFFHLCFKTQHNLNMEILGNSNPNFYFENRFRII